MTDDMGGLSDADGIEQVYGVLGKLPGRTRPLRRVGRADTAMIVNDNPVPIGERGYLPELPGLPGQSVPETNKKGTPVPKLS